MRGGAGNDTMAEVKAMINDCKGDDVMHGGPVTCTWRAGNDTMAGGEGNDHVW